MARSQIIYRNSTRTWRFHKTTSGGPGALFFSSPMPEPEEGPSRTPIGGHLPNCGLLERNTAGGTAPQPVGGRSVNLATCSYTAQLAGSSSPRSPPTPLSKKTYGVPTVYRCTARAPTSLAESTLQGGQCPAVPRSRTLANLAGSLGLCLFGLNLSKLLCITDERVPRACPRTDMHGAYTTPQSRQGNETLISHERGQRMHPDILVALLSRGTSHVAAGCALSMQGTSAGNRIKETTRTRMKETIRNTKSTGDTSGMCAPVHTETSAIPAIPAVPR
jgi:hypothetical protein